MMFPERVGKGYLNVTENENFMEEVLEVLVYLYVRVLIEMGLVAEDLVIISLQKEL